MKGTSTAASLALITLTVSLGASLAAAPTGAARAAAPVVDTGSADEAEIEFRLGNEAYVGRNFRSALAHYFASNRLAPNRNVLFNIARCYEKLSRYVEAYRYYEAFRVSGAGQDGAEDQAVRRAMQRIRPRVALLRVESEPPGATLYLNREDLGAHGVTPKVLAVAPGAYRVILRHPGFERYVSDEVRVGLGADARVDAALVRRTGVLRVTGTPAGAKVTIDDPAGTVSGALPATVTVSIGSHPLRVEQPGYVTYEGEAEIEADKASYLRVELRRETGTVVVDGDEAGALILMDGEPRGFTPTVLEGVSTGQHKLIVRLAGFREYATEVDVVAGERAEVHAALPWDDGISAASRSRESTADAPASVSVIARPEIDGLGYVTVADSLVGTRGVYTSNDRTYSYPGVRGFSPFGDYGNRVQLQLDGHALNDDWLGASYIEHDLLVSLDPVEAIEVVRGPNSVLYGSNAFFGVLNLVTPSKIPASTVRGGMTMAGQGTFGAFTEGQLKLGDEAGAWAYVGGLYRQPYDYVSPARVNLDTGDSGVAHNVGETAAASVLGRAWYRDLTLQWYYHQRDLQPATATFGTVFDTRAAETDDRRGFVELRYEPHVSRTVQLLTRLAYDHYGYHGVYPYEVGHGGLATETYHGDWLSAEFRTILTPVKSTRVTLGADYQYHFDNAAWGKSAEAAEPYLTTSNPFHTFSAFAIGDLAPVDAFAASAGVRVDGWSVADLPFGDDGSSRVSRFFWTLNPRLTLRLRPAKGSTFKLMGGRAFRAPSVYEMTYNDGGQTQRPPKEILQPEQVWTGELEYTQDLGADVAVTGATYLNYISGLIDVDGSGTASSPFRYYNMPSPIWNMGAEVELRKTFRRGTFFALSYSWQRTRIDSLSASLTVPNSPVHLGSVKVVVPILGRELRLGSRLSVDAGRLDRLGAQIQPILLWDVALSGKIPDVGLSYSAGVRNLLDWKYGYPVGREILDRQVAQQGLTFVLDIRFDLF